MVADTTHRTADFVGFESLSPPLRVRVRKPALRPVRAPGCGRTRYVHRSWRNLGNRSGGHCIGDGGARRRLDRPMCFRPRPPGGACPIQTLEPHRLDDPVSARWSEQSPCHCSAGVMLRRRRARMSSARKAFDREAGWVTGRRRRARGGRVTRLGNGKAASDSRRNSCGAMKWWRCYPSVTNQRG